MGGKNEANLRRASGPSSNNSVARTEKGHPRDMRVPIEWGGHSKNLLGKKKEKSDAT